MAMKGIEAGRWMEFQDNIPASTMRDRGRARQTQVKVSIILSRESVQVNLDWKYGLVPDTSLFRTNNKLTTVSLSAIV
jgi:hypothetical protein